MPKSNTFKNSLVLHIFNNVAIANIGDATGLPASATAGNFYLSLHTADPVAGTQSTNEATYTGYARIAVTRTSGAWSVVSGVATNLALLAWGQCTGGSNTISHVGVGTAASGTGGLLYSNPLNSSATLAVSAGITPQVAIGDLSVGEL